MLFRNFLHKHISHFDGLNASYIMKKAVGIRSLATGAPSEKSNHDAKRVCQITEQILNSKTNNNGRIHDTGRIIARGKLENFVKEYGSFLSVIGKRKFFLYLCEEFSYDQAQISSQCRALLECTENERDISTLLQSEFKLKKLLIPFYCGLFLQLGSLDNGVKFLIDMRSDIHVEIVRDIENRNEVNMLTHLSTQVKEILSTWFSVGMLQLQRITWHTPADILEKVAKYEAVHLVRGWNDLKHRLGADRRCYAFFHGSMANEPVILLHVALTEKISDNITDILDYGPTAEKSDSKENADNTSCAIFYSITSTQKGLQGIELGPYLIQAVVRQLRQELPNLHTFSSLSPIPGFQKWLMKELNRESVLNHLSEAQILELKNAMQYQDVTDISLTMFLKDILGSGKHLNDSTLSALLKDSMVTLCALYICKAKRRGYALDPVANFHLKNGAVVWRINWMADRSRSGMKQSFSLMANYRYYLDSMGSNSNNYITNMVLPMSESVRSRLPEDISITSNSNL